MVVPEAWERGGGGVRSQILRDSGSFRRLGHYLAEDFRNLFGRCQTRSDSSDPMTEERSFEVPDMKQLSPTATRRNQSRFGTGQ